MVGAPEGYNFPVKDAAIIQRSNPNAYAGSIKLIKQLFSKGIKEIRLGNYIIRKDENGNLKVYEAATGKKTDLSIREALLEIFGQDKAPYYLYAVLKQLLTLDLQGISIRLKDLVASLRKRNPNKVDKEALARINEGAIYYLNEYRRLEGLMTGFKAATKKIEEDTSKDVKNLQEKIAQKQTAFERTRVTWKAKPAEAKKKVSNDENSPQIVNRHSVRFKDSTGRVYNYDFVSKTKDKGKDGKTNNGDEVTIYKQLTNGQLVEIGTFSTKLWGLVDGGTLVGGARDGNMTYNEKQRFLVALVKFAVSKGYSLAEAFGKYNNKDANFENRNLDVELTAMRTIQKKLGGKDLSPEKLRETLETALNFSGSVTSQVVNMAAGNNNVSAERAAQYCMRTLDNPGNPFKGPYTLENIMAWFRKGSKPVDNVTLAENAEEETVDDESITQREGFKKIFHYSLRGPNFRPGVFRNAALNFIQGLVSNQQLKMANRALTLIAEKAKGEDEKRTKKYYEELYGLAKDSEILKLFMQKYKELGKYQAALKYATKLGEGARKKEIEEIVKESRKNVQYIFEAGNKETDQAKKKALYDRALKEIKKLGALIASVKGSVDASLVNVQRKSLLSLRVRIAYKYAELKNPDWRKQAPALVKDIPDKQLIDMEKGENQTVPMEARVIKDELRRMADLDPNLRKAEGYLFDEDKEGRPVWNLRTPEKTRTYAFKLLEAIISKGDKQSKAAALVLKARALIEIGRPKLNLEDKPRKGEGDKILKKAAELLEDAAKLYKELSKDKKFDKKRQADFKAQRKQAYTQIGMIAIHYNSLASRAKELAKGGWRRNSSIFRQAKKAAKPIPDAITLPFGESGTVGRFFKKQMGKKDAGNKLLKKKEGTDKTSRSSGKKASKDKGEKLR